MSLTADRVALLDLSALLDAHLNDDAGHGRTHGARIRRGLFARDGLNSGVLVLDGHGANLTHHQKPIPSLHA